MASTRRCQSLKSALAITLILLLHPLPSRVFAADAGTTESFTRTERPKGRKESLLSLIFGSTVPLPTERGILLIEAFHDLNNNGTLDTGESEILNDVKCTVGDYDFKIPAFIPGLTYNETYRIACTGTQFEPELPKDAIFIERRGEIYRLVLPCTSLSPKE